MKLISHRGNINGQIRDENKPELIEKVISKGFDVEIDVRKHNNQLFLGHDSPDYLIKISWLLKFSDKLWIHCKTLDTLNYFSNNEILKKLNFFFHNNDHATITSRGFIWVYPGFQPVKNSIAVLPELNNDDTSQCFGICSDFIEKYKK